MHRPAVSLVLSASLVASSLMTLMAGPVTIGKDGDGLCRLLTAREVKQALGPGKWQIADEGDVADQCYMHNGRLDRKSRAFSMRLLRSNEENQEEWRDDALSSGAVEQQVAGFPALVDDHAAVTIFFPDPWDILQLSPVGFEGDDVSAANLALAKLAAGRHGTELGMAAGASPSPLPSGGAAVLSACELLTDAEVTAAVGAAMARDEASDTAMCQWVGDQGSVYAFVRVDVAAPGASPSVLDLSREAMRGAADVEVAGLPASQATGPEGDSSILFVVPADGVGVTVSLMQPGATDVAAKVLALAELAVARAPASGDPAPIPPAPIPPAASAAVDASQAP